MNHFAQESSSRVWKKVIVFYSLALLLNEALRQLIVPAGEDGEGGLYGTAHMWGPAIAAIATKALFRESLRTFGWQWGQTRFQVWSYAIPVLYALPVYLVVWISGLGGFPNNEFVQHKAQVFGWEQHSTATIVIGYVVLTATFGVIISLSRSLGEEIGWRGFLVPELSKVVGAKSVALISGVMWAAWHYPGMLRDDYGDIPAWYAFSCVTILAVAVAFILTWLRLRSGSLWTAVILHATHNRLIQGALTPLTVDTGPTEFIIDEYGAGLALTSVIAAIIVWRTGRRLPEDARAL